ncbi:MAG: LysR family transcriptional regulator [Eubacteriales bacterium]
MNIHKLQYFISLAETSNFTKAAKANYITQTAMSQQISSMEKELEVRLFDRTKNKVSITQAGQYFLEETKVIVERYQQALRNTKKIGKGSSGNLTIGYCGPTEKELLCKIMEFFIEKHPSVNVFLQNENFKQLYNNLDRETCDVVISLSGEVEKEVCFDRIILKKDVAVLAVSKKHPKADVKKMHASEVAGERIIMVNEEYGRLNYSHMVKSCMLDGYEPNIIEKVTSLDTLMLMVELNRGVTFLPRSQAHAFNDKVAFIQLLGTNHSFTIEMAWKASNENEYLQEFIQTAKKCR